ncbi:MAG: MFS transporter [Veillonella sp.]|nr:MFS transporter [Veillonella sp.]
MFSFLQPKEAKSSVPQSMIMNLYYKYRLQSLIGIFIGYAAYYIVRNNFALSTHFLSDILHMSKTEIGLLSSGMLIAYGLSKGFMSSLADKASPAKFMAFGLICCAIINIFMSFADSLAFFLVLVVLNGFFQGFGVGPSFITLAKWYPKQERGRYGAIWNISHNLGGGIVAPIVAAALYFTTTDHWQLGSYGVPALIAVIIAIAISFLIKESPEREGLPPTSEIIASTIFAGYISDKFFKGYRMPPAIIAISIIFFCIFGYWQSESLLWVTFFAAIVGCLIYIPQFLASVQTMDIVPPFAVGSAVGLRGFMSYIVGANLGTTLFGVLADKFGWNAGFYLLLVACVLCITFCVLAHFGAKELDAKEAELEQLQPAEANS